MWFSSILLLYFKKNIPFIVKELGGELSNFILHAARRQKEEALNFRAKKENEVSAVEKVRILAHMVIVEYVVLL
jgi:hypothetical protein